MSLRPLVSPSVSAFISLALSCATAAYADSFGSGPNSFDIEFVRIGNPGNAANTTGSPNPVGSVGAPYRIGKFEISEQMIGKANALGGLGITKDARGPDKPATSVSWNEAARFVNWLNTSSGSAPAYKFALQPREALYSANANIELWTVSDAGYNPNNLYRNSLARYFLPSADEWYKAAYYDPTSGVYLDFPTGSDRVPTAVASVTAAGTVVYGQSFFTGPANITLAGGLSPYGTMGQGGNVWEWEETDLDLVNGPTMSSSVRVIHGGDWYGQSRFFHTLIRNNGFPDSEIFQSVGFRVASIPEPSSLLLGALAGLGLLAPRRVRRAIVHHVMREERATRIVSAAAVTIAAMTLITPAASAAYVAIYGGPTGTTSGVVGFEGGSVWGINDAGAAVGTAYISRSTTIGDFNIAVRWDSSGAPPIELGLGFPLDINEAGTAVGVVDFFHPSSTAVRWDPSGAATELRNLGVTPCCDEMWFGTARSINHAGVAVGWAEKYSEVGAYQGFHAVRWDTSAVPTELESLGSNSEAVAINDVGTVVGWADLGVSFGQRAVRWEASVTAVTELGHLGTNLNDVARSSAVAINYAGTAVGWADKYDSSGVSLGQRAVRWDASGTVATELDLVDVGTWSDGTTSSRAVAINDAGTAVGYADHIDSSGAYRGARAVRWDASGTTATELGNLGTNDDITETDVFAINDAGIAVGYADDYDDFGANLGERAVYWGLDALAIDLNTLIDPVSGWTLNRATAISDTGWIGGSGAFDPDGPGGQEAYVRLFLIQVPAPSVLPGDYNGNGIVDAADYTVWRDRLGSDTALANDDTPGVGPDDYDRWKMHFGELIGGNGSGAALPSAAPLSPTVPEPTTFALVIIVGTVVLCAKQVVVDRRFRMANSQRQSMKLLLGWAPRK